MAGGAIPGNRVYLQAFYLINICRKKIVFHVSGDSKETPFTLYFCNKCSMKTNVHENSC